MGVGSPVTVRYRAATVADVPAMARSRLADPAAGRADNAVARAFYTRLGATELNRFWFVWSDVGILEAGAGPGDPGRDSS